MTRSIVSLIALAACQPTTLGPSTIAEDIWQQSPTDQLDILWVIDDSPSMDASRITAGVHAFVSELESSRIDVHLGVVTTAYDPLDPRQSALLGDPAVLTGADDDPTLFTDRALVDTDGGTREQGLAAAAIALSPTLSPGFLRETADTLVVVVSSGDDCSDDRALGSAGAACDAQPDALVPVETWVSRLQAETSGELRLVAIVGPAEPTDDACEASTTPGLRYIDAADQTNGVVGNICEPGWTSAIRGMGLFSTGVHTTFFLANPAKPGTLEVLVDAVVVPPSQRDGYTYDPETNAITFHGASIPPRGSTIAATYAIAAVR